MTNTIISFSDNELEIVRFAVADKVFNINKQAETGLIDSDDATQQIETLRKVVEKCTRFRA